MDEFWQNDFREAAARRRESAQQIHERQSDAAGQDMRVIGAAIASAVVSSDDPQQFAGLNAGVRVPTTVDHPGNPVKA